MQATTIEDQNAFASCASSKFHVTDSQNTRDQITSDRRSNSRDQIALCAFHLFLVEVPTNAGYIHASHA